MKLITAYHEEILGRFVVSRHDQGRTHIFSEIEDVLEFIVYELTGEEPEITLKESKPATEKKKRQKPTRERRQPAKSKPSR